MIFVTWLASAGYSTQFSSRQWSQALAFRHEVASRASMSSVAKAFERGEVFSFFDAAAALARAPLKPRAGLLQELELGGSGAAAEGCISVREAAETVDDDLVALGEA